MNCPTCRDNTGIIRKMKVTNVYLCVDDAKEHKKYRRLFCSECLTVATEMIVLVNINPKRGEGAVGLSKKITNDQKTSP